MSNPFLPTKYSTYASIQALVIGNNTDGSAKFSTPEATAQYNAYSKYMTANHPTEMTNSIKKHILKNLLLLKKISLKVISLYLPRLYLFLN